MGVERGGAVNERSLVQVHETIYENGSNLSVNFTVL